MLVAGLSTKAPPSSNCVNNKIQYPMKTSHIICLFWGIFLLHACKQKQFGSLEVQSLTAGNYEIYRILGDTALTFISNESGAYNQEIRLESGGYLVLADCSAKSIVIHPNTKTSIIAHRLKFLPPTRPQPGDLFKVQCSRHSMTHAPQTIVNRFELSILEGQVRELLVGLSPVVFDFLEDESTTPKSQEYELAGINVSWPPSIAEIDSSRYFVSIKHSDQAITQGQKLGKRQFLLPNTYRVTVNGTHQDVVLRSGDLRDLPTASLAFTTSPKVDFSEFQNVRGEPYMVSVNGIDSFMPNQRYLFLPGRIEYQLPDGLDKSAMILEQEKHHNVGLNSLIVKQNCSPMEWECIGKKHLNLYKGLDSKPTIKSTTDVPILYDEKIESLYAEMEAAKGLKIKLPNTSLTELGVGTVTVFAEEHFSRTVTTDVVRIEGTGQDSYGFSYDLPRRTRTTYHLINGSYKLVSYNTPLNLIPSPKPTQLSSHVNISVTRGSQLTLHAQYNTMKLSLQPLLPGSHNLRPLNRPFARLVYPGL